MATPARALITGIDGFTGHYVAEELRAAGYRVFGTAERTDADAGLFHADLGDKAGLERVIAAVKPNVVVHLAAISFVGHGDAEAFYRVNLVGTRNLLEALAAAAMDLDCVLLASSANVYGNSVGGVLNEETPFNPANDYAVSKVAMEFMARLWMGRLPIVITRPFNYTGIGQSEVFLLPKIIAHARKRAPVIELGNLDVWRDFCDVRAVARAYRQLIQAKPIGQAVNVCSGKTHSLREIVDMVQILAGYRFEIRVNPNFVRANEVTTLSGDASRLTSLLGHWHPPALASTLEWMMEEPPCPATQPNHR